MRVSHLSSQKLPEPVRHAEIGVSARVFSCSHNSLTRYLVGAFFTSDPREVYIVLHAMFIDHHHEDQVLIDGSAQNMAAQRAEEIKGIAFLVFKCRVFHAVVITDQRGEQQESAFLFLVAYPEDDPVPYLEMPAAMGTNKIIFHDAWDLGFFTSYEILQQKSIPEKR